MSKDLEATLKELGEDYRPVVDRLRAAYQVPVELSAVRSRPVQSAPRSGRAIGWGIGYLVAASVLVFLGLGVAFRASNPSASPRIYTVRATTAENEYRLASIRNDEAVKEMIRTQNPDGSWKNDFLTRQNAAALRLCKDSAAQVAYRKAARNLRLRGLN